METVEVVIRIPKQVYEHVNVWKDLVYDDYIAMVGNAILNCTVLPKGHGRLIDADALEKDFEKCNCRCDCVFPVCPVYNQKIIIEADREVDND